MAPTLIAVIKESLKEIIFIGKNLLGKKHWDLINSFRYENRQVISCVFQQSPVPDSYCVIINNYTKYWFNYPTQRLPNHPSK